MRTLACRALISLLLTSVAFAADPDFSGVWSLNDDRSEQGRLPDRPWKLMKVEHSNSEIRCVPVEASVPTKPAGKMLMHFATTGKETSHPVGEGSGKSITKWEGSALLINTLVSTPQRSYTQMDRWKLSRDGNTLTVRRQIVNLHGETESMLVYEKQGSGSK
jgi:hypothetical protein